MATSYIGVTEEVMNIQSCIKRKKKSRWMLGMKNVEDIEIRIFGGSLQWKYWKNKKWNYIELRG